MRPITIDIETLPDQRPGALEKFLESAKLDFKAPGTLTKEAAARDLGITDANDIKFTNKEAMIARWEKAFAAIKGPEVAEAEYRKTALNAAQGQILMIGMSAEDDDAQVICESTEADTLQHFFEQLERESRDSHRNQLQFIGHNLVGFDLRFITQRAMILGVKPHISFPINPRPWDESVYDTMLQWAGVGNRISLDALCMALGLPGKGEIDGSMVWDLYKTGRIDDLVEYCADDVRKTRAAWLRMTFQQETDVLKGMEEAEAQSS